MAGAGRSLPASASMGLNRCLSIELAGRPDVTKRVELLHQVA